MDRCGEIKATLTALAADGGVDIFLAGHGLAEIRPKPDVEPHRAIGIGVVIADGAIGADEIDAVCPELSTERFQQGMDFTQVAFRQWVARNGKLERRLDQPQQHGAAHELAVPRLDTQALVQGGGGFFQGGSMVVDGAGFEKKDTRHAHGNGKQQAAPKGDQSQGEITRGLTRHAIIPRLETEKGPPVDGSSAANGTCLFPLGRLPPYRRWSSDTGRSAWHAVSREVPTMRIVASETIICQGKGIGRAHCHVTA